MGVYSPLLLVRLLQLLHPLAPSCSHESQTRMFPPPLLHPFPWVSICFQEEVQNMPSSDVPPIYEYLQLLQTCLLYCLRQRRVVPNIVRLDQGYLPREPLRHLVVNLLPGSLPYGGSLPMSLTPKRASLELPPGRTYSRSTYTHPPDIGSAIGGTITTTPSAGYQQLLANCSPPLSMSVPGIGNRTLSLGADCGM